MSSQAVETQPATRGPYCTVEEFSHGPAASAWTFRRIWKMGPRTIYSNISRFYHQGSLASTQGVQSDNCVSKSGAMWQHVFDERNYSKERACFIIDLILVLQIYHQFMKPQMSFIRTINRAFRNRSGEFILCSKVLSMYVDQEKVEICMCLKRYMCYDLWRRIGSFISVVEERAWILHDYKFWIAEHNNLYGGCLERAIWDEAKTVSSTCSEMLGQNQTITPT